MGCRVNAVMHCFLLAPMNLQRNSRARVAAAFVGAVVLGVFFSESTVYAECGDYVIVGRPSMKFQSADWQSHLGMLEVQPGHGPMGPGGERPCTGPSCRNDDSSMPVPNIASPSGAPQWAFICPFGRSTHPEAVSFGLPRPILYRGDFVAAVWHPPRSA